VGYPTAAVLDPVQSRVADRLNSLSLGGYIASLVASLEKGLTCAILGVPVADLVELLGATPASATMTPAVTP